MNFKLFTRNGVMPWIKGAFPAYLFPANTGLQAGSVNVGRLSIQDTYTVGKAYSDVPLELTNALFLKTRELQLSNARIKTLKQQGDIEYNAEIHKQIDSDLKALDKLVTLLKGKKTIDEPASFAAYTLYLQTYHDYNSSFRAQERIVQLLISKAQYLHQEGVAAAIWACSRMEKVNEELLTVLLDRADFKQINYLEPLATFASGGYKRTTHVFESEISQPLQEMFFSDQIIAVECLDGLERLQTRQLSSGLQTRCNELANTIKETFPQIKDKKELYQDFTRGSVE